MVTGIDLLRDGLVKVRAGVAEPQRDALQEWAEEADEAGVTVPEAAATPVAAGTCKLCNTRAATVVCLHCNNAVCAADHWIMFGLCRACLTPDEMRTAREAKAGPPPDLGIKWVDE